jgi:hypothetical protein
MERAGKHQDIRSRRRQPIHLLPGRVTDAARAQLMGEAVEDPNPVTGLVHNHSLQRSKSMEGQPIEISNRWHILFHECEEPFHSR